MGISTAIAGGVFSIGEKLIDRLFPDPEERAKAAKELAKMEQEGELRELEARMEAISTEAKSEDPWTSRARPSFLYVFYFVILSLVVVAPLVGVFYPDQMETFFDNVGKGFDAIPEELWWTFTMGFLGYGTFRSMDKKNLKKHLKQ